MIEVWCNGNTQLFGSCIVGSNPSTSTINKYMLKYQLPSESELCNVCAESHSMKEAMRKLGIGFTTPGLNRKSLLRKIDEYGIDIKHFTDINRT